MSGLVRLAILGGIAYGVWRLTRPEPQPQLPVTTYGTAGYPALGGPGTYTAGGDFGNVGIGTGPTPRGFHQTYGDPGYNSY